MHIHFIGICGVAMSALAIAFHKKGWKVTGSDAGFYPPISTKLDEVGVSYYPGWHPEKMGTPDLVVVGNVAGSKNPEWLYVQENKISYKSYPEVVAEYFVKENSIVCAGTYGKTTSSVLLSWILSENNFEPAWMFGGLSLNNLNSASMGSSDISSEAEESLKLNKANSLSISPHSDQSNKKKGWSVLEGDEYKASKWDNRAKFYYYKPTHLLLTAVVWDHADVYPTEQSYIDAFQDLYEMVPDSGLRVVSEKAIELINTKEKKVISYGRDENNSYRYLNIKQTKHGISFDIKHNNKVYNIKTQALGEFMADNMTGCFALAHEIGVEPKNIINSLASFKSVKRRLEKRFEKKITVFDDIAHSPSKAEAILNSLRTVYDGNIYAVFEPNSGNRFAQSKDGYDNAFVSATEVIIPRLTKIKSHPNNPDKPMDGPELAVTIGATHDNVTYIEDDSELVSYLANNTKKDDVIVFLGSHGFRGMIEKIISKVS